MWYIKGDTIGAKQSRRAGGSNLTCDVYISPHEQGWWLPLGYEQWKGPAMVEFWMCFVGKQNFLTGCLWSVRGGGESRMLQGFWLETNWKDVVDNQWQGKVCGELTFVPKIRSPIVGHALCDGKFCVSVWLVHKVPGIGQTLFTGCFWIKLTFELADWVEQTALPVWVGLIQSPDGLNRTESLTCPWTRENGLLFLLLDYVHTWTWPFFFCL